MTKLVIDYPVKYTESSYGDTTFVLAHLYQKNENYKRKIDYVKSQGRETMLDNGAWEFGSSMPVRDYIEIIRELQPTFAVIPDVFMNRIQSDKMTLEFLDHYDLDVETEFMYAPQGENPEEVIEAYNENVDLMGEFFDTLAIPKWIGKEYNRVDFMDELYEKAIIKPKNVHFLGFWDWEELDVTKLHSWELVSIDTKYPVKEAFKPETFMSQLDYYNTNKILDKTAFQIEVDSFYVNLHELGWLHV